MRTEFAKLLKLLKKRYQDADLDLVRKAYRLANEAHTGQTRESGEPYVFHCIEVARILTQIGLDLTTIAAALLHDVIEDTPIRKEELVREFGEEIATLVEGVTKISTLTHPKGVTQADKQAVNLRKMLVATAKDVRVVLIKLADRLHNMRTIEALSEDKIQRISRETLDIYAPLAHRLGIARWKWELEDHAFHRLHPAEYDQMARLVAMKRREREAWLNETCEYLQERLALAEVVAEVEGRPKHLYSIYLKMIQQGKTYGQVMDIQAVRIVTKTMNECYNALGMVHHLWPPVPGRFKDYIAVPKVNMYQSIHTTVMCENGLPLEIQIRTDDMDRIAREGIAAHWAYKERNARQDAKLEAQLIWLRQMYEWIKDAHGPEELIDGVRRDVGEREIYVFTPKGEVKELVSGATPLDFAYAIHSDIGHHCIGARVNGAMVPLRYNLQTGDAVEILTSKNQRPHRDWVDVVVTARARARIRQKLREIGELEPIEAKRVGIDLPQPEQRHRVVRHVVDAATREKMVRIEGLGGYSVSMAKCCDPMPGHAIVGYVTKACAITIHRRECPNFNSTPRDRGRVVMAAWQGEAYTEFGLRVSVGQRPNMLADVTDALRPMNVSICRANLVTGADGRSSFEFVFEAPDKSAADRIKRTLRTVVGVKSVSELDPTLVASPAKTIPPTEPRVQAAQTVQSSRRTEAGVPQSTLT